MSTLQRSSTPIGRMSPHVPDGWSIEQHHPLTGGWRPNEETLYLSTTQKGGGWQEGYELRRILVCLPVVSADVLDFLLLHPHLIPNAFVGHAVFFWGTVYRTQGGCRAVRCLCQKGSRGWDWSCNWLHLLWGKDHPAALAVQPLQGGIP